MLQEIIAKYKELGSKEFEIWLFERTIEQPETIEIYQFYRNHPDDFRDFLSVFWAFVPNRGGES